MTNKFDSLTTGQVYDLWAGLDDIELIIKELDPLLNRVAGAAQVGKIIRDMVNLQNEALDEMNRRAGHPSPAPVRDVPEWAEKHLPRWLLGHQRGGGGTK